MRTNLKKALIAIMALITILSLSLMVACGGKGSNPTPTPPPTQTVTVTLDKTTVSLEVGQTVTLNATVTGSTDPVEWSSSNAMKATVNDGVVMGVEAGFAMITAKVGNVKATCEVTITEPEGVILPVITLNNSSTQIYRGQPLNLYATVTLGGEEVPDAVIIYESSDSSVVTVSSEGIVTGVTKGTATVTANCTYDGKVATERSIVITVVDMTIVYFTNDNMQTIRTGETLVLNAVVALNGEELTNPDIVFSISDPSAATISGNVLKAIDKVDKLLVTATYVDGAEEYSDTITVFIEYSVISSGALSLTNGENVGEIFIETDKELNSATLDGSLIEFTAVEGGYNVDISVFDVNNATQQIIMTDTDGVKYLVKVYTVVKEVTENIVKARPEAAYSGVTEAGVTAFGRTGVLHATGPSNAAWQNCFHISFMEYLAKGYTYVAFDIVFVPATNEYMGFLGSDGTYVRFNVGQPVESSEFTVYDSNGNEANFAKKTWRTIVVNLEYFGGNLEFYSTDNYHAYVDNVRFMTAEGYECFVNGDIYEIPTDAPAIPDTAEVSLDNAIGNPGSDYTLTRAAATETFIGKTAIRFTGANLQDWKNNLLISITDVKYSYKWILVDFYFNSDNVAFNTVENGYQFITYGAKLTNGSFYAVAESDGTYYSVPVIKGKWITLAFRSDDMGDYIDGIMSSAVYTYVANIRAVSANVLNEPVAELPATLTVSLDNAIGNPGSDYRLTRVGETTYSGKTAIQFTGTNEALWRNNLLIYVGEYKSDYKWVLVDFYFNSDTVMLMANDYTALTYGEKCTNGAFYVVEENDGVYTSVPAAKAQWITVAFKLSSFNGDYINAIMIGAVDTYVSNIRVLQASALDEVVVNP